MSNTYKFSRHLLICLLKKDLEATLSPLCYRSLKSPPSGAQHSRDAMRHPWGGTCVGATELGALQRCVIALHPTLCRLIGLREIYKTLVSIFGNRVRVLLCRSERECSEQGLCKGAIPRLAWAHSRTFSTSGLQLVWPLALRQCLQGTESQEPS